MWLRLLNIVMFTISLHRPLQVKWKTSICWDTALGESKGARWRQNRPVCFPFPFNDNLRSKSNTFLIEDEWSITRPQTVLFTLRIREDFTLNILNI